MFTALSFIIAGTTVLTLVVIPAIYGLLMKG